MTTLRYLMKKVRRILYMLGGVFTDILDIGVSKNATDNFVNTIH